MLVTSNAKIILLFHSAVVALAVSISHCLTQSRQLCGSDEIKCGFCQISLFPATFICIFMAPSKTSINISVNALRIVPYQC